jgi:hypothetical protein
LEKCIYKSQTTGSVKEKVKLSPYQALEAYRVVRSVLNFNKLLSEVHTMNYEEPEKKSAPIELNYGK